MNYRRVFVRELTAEDAQLYLRAQRRRSRGRRRRRSATKCLVKSAANRVMWAADTFVVCCMYSLWRRLRMANLGDMMLAALMTGQSTVGVG
jgi:hypothetical protein